MRLQQIQNNYLYEGLDRSATISMLLWESAGKAKQIGTNLTTKVTADKLNSAWQKAGAPTDSEEVKAFLTNQNVNPDVINKVFTDLKISATPTAKADSGGYAEIKKSIMQLNNKDRQRMIQYLTKQLGTT